MAGRPGPRPRRRDKFGAWEILLQGQGSETRRSGSTGHRTARTGALYAKAGRAGLGGYSPVRRLGSPPTGSAPTGPGSVSFPAAVGVVDRFSTWDLKNSNSPGFPDARLFAYGAPGWTAVSGTWALPGQALHAEAVSQGEAGSGALSAEALRPILDAALTRGPLRAEPRFEIGRLEGNLLGLAFA